MKKFFVLCCLTALLMSFITVPKVNDPFEKDYKSFVLAKDNFHKVTAELKTDADWTNMSPEKKQLLNKAAVNLRNTYGKLTMYSNYQARLRNPDCLGCRVGCYGAFYTCTGSWCGSICAEYCSRSLETCLAQCHCGDE